MFSKHKGKGKGVGKGQSNRHKNSRYHRNNEINEATGSVPNNTTLFNPNESLKNKKKQNKLQDKQKQRLIRYQGSSASTALLREDPLMADLLWKNVQPDEECIPRFSKEFRDSLPSKVTEKSGSEINFDDGEANDPIEDVIDDNTTSGFFKDKNNPSKSNERREDPLMSDLMWEKVDTDDECIPRMKQPTLSSEDEISYDNENTSNAKSIYDTNYKFKRIDLNNDAKSTKINNVGSQNLSQELPKNKTVRRQKRVKHGAKRSRMQDKKDSNTDLKYQLDKTANSLSNTDGKSNNLVIGHESPASSTSSFCHTKSSRQRNIDTIKTVSDLSILWCIKEFETKLSDKSKNSSNQNHVLGQVIQQGNDIYFQPSCDKLSKTKREIPSTSRSHVDKRSKNDIKDIESKAIAENLTLRGCNLESCELETDGTSISVSNTSDESSKKLKPKNKKNKKRLSSIRKNITNNRKKTRRKNSSKLVNDSSNRWHMIRKFSGRTISNRNELMCSLEKYEMSSYKEEMFAKEVVNDDNHPFESSSTLQLRSRKDNRSIHSSAGNRLIRQRKNVDHAEIDSSPESYRNISKPFDRAKHLNLGYKISKGRKIRDIDSKDASETPPLSVNNDLDLIRCNYYLRRQTPTYNGIDKKWILVESQHIL